MILVIMTIRKSVSKDRYPAAPLKTSSENFSPMNIHIANKANRYS
jgi:hypothetical protein